MKRLHDSDCPVDYDQHEALLEIQDHCDWLLGDDPAEAAKLLNAAEPDEPEWITTDDVKAWNEWADPPNPEPADIQVAWACNRIRNS